MESLTGGFRLSPSLTVSSPRRSSTVHQEIWCIDSTDRGVAEGCGASDTATHRSFLGERVLCKPASLQA